MTLCRVWQLCNYGETFTTTISLSGQIADFKYLADFLRNISIIDLTESLVINPVQGSSCTYCGNGKRPVIVNQFFSSTHTSPEYSQQPNINVY